MTISTISAILIGCLFYIMYRIRRKQNKRLHRLNATKDKLFSIISHDLKSPVAAQRIAVENMLENLDNYDIQLLQKNLHEFQQATEVQLELLQNLLNWARVQTGEIKFRPVSLNISEIITEVAELYHLPAQNKDITFNIDVDKDCIVEADRQMMHTILRNLINNAVKFSHENSEILLQAKCTEKVVTVCVKDYGIGISDENMKRLLAFDENLSTSGTNGEAGSGLGLLITRKMLERNGSNLIINSVEGQGTEAMFSLIVNE
ncbi:MAG TPA: HAMP domain-containing histidine kinase [Bacteroidales bacterium]|nr:HAMP domain-containing histidine kinase [Bacteroidales bacterium]